MKDDGWETVLKEPPKKALDRFLDEGLIRPSGLHGKLDHEFKLPALKTLLKDRTLKVSGKKEDLIERLIELDAPGMEKLVKGQLVFECTERGLERSKSYLDEEKKKKTAVEMQVFQALQNHEFDKACQIANSYHKQEVFSSEIGCDSTFIKSIFVVKPKILKKFNDHQLNALRIVAGMMQLLYCRKASDWLPSGFNLDSHLKAESAARMLIFHCYYLKNLNGLKGSGFKKAKIFVVEDSCEHCKKLKDKTYAINKVPELPFEECTCEMGCRCLLSADSNSG
ncbi:MAG: SAP domain-containing protein [Methanothrix sp.]|nr:SAP domain-containing protein [Methanothrix sp.]